MKYIYTKIIDKLEFNFILYSDYYTLRVEGPVKTLISYVMKTTLYPFESSLFSGDFIDDCEIHINEGYGFLYIDQVNYSIDFWDFKAMLEEDEEYKKYEE